MPVRPPLGQSDFTWLRKDGFTYVDKTAEVAAILSSAASVILLTRPRRFGKTLLMSTLRAFVERQDLAKQDTAPLFEGTAIAVDPTAARFQQRFPVVSFSLREIKPPDFDTLLELMRRDIRSLLGDHRWLVEQGRLGEDERALWETITRGSPSAAQLQDVPRWLTKLLYEATGERVVLLIDEYDTPLHTAWLRGYHDQAIDFLRPFLSGGLKDNPALFKGVVTGITRIAKESLFSGVNNMVTASMLDSLFPTACGFTDAEVGQLLAAADLADRHGDVRRWYNGYRVGETTLYNPWSVLRFLFQLEDGFLPHWLNTGGDDLLRSLLLEGPAAARMEMDALLHGGAVERTMLEHLALRDLQNDANAIWTLLVHAGYLHMLERRWADGQVQATLSAPNEEVRLGWVVMFRRWFDQAADGESQARMLSRALLAGDAAVFEEILQLLVMRTMSALDPGGDAPERVWHAFILGLLAHMIGTHRVQSEAEAGVGRADVLVVPHRPGLAGAVLEFKRVRGSESVEAALDAAMAQINQRRYVDRLVEAGASPRWKLAVAFAGKVVRVRVEEG
jgi:hypothetical protein